MRREQAKRASRTGWTPAPWGALARAAQTMDKADLWRARLAVKTLRLDQREAIAEAAGLFFCSSRGTLCPCAP